MPANPNLLPVSEAAKAATASALGYKDWDEATDYRLTGAQDRQRDATAQAFARFEHSMTADIVAMLEGMKREDQHIRVQRNAVIDEAIAKAKAMRRAGS